MPADVPPLLTVYRDFVNRKFLTRAIQAYKGRSSRCTESKGDAVGVDCVAVCSGVCKVANSICKYCCMDVLTCTSSLTFLELSKSRCAAE